MMNGSDATSSLALPDNQAGADRLFLQLNTLRIVAAIVRSSGMPAAAVMLGRSMSSLSRALTDLEGVLGVKLMERRRGNVVSTTHGVALFSRVDRIEAELAAVQAELVRQPGSSPSAIQHLLQSGRKLLLLIRIADAGSVSSAASASGISQAGVSQALARIEDAISRPLFHRSVRGVLPTDIGQRLILKLRLIRTELRHALSELASLEGGAVGTTIIGTLPMARADILPRAIGACLDAGTQLRVQILEAQRDSLLAKLRAGEIDALLFARSSSFNLRGLIVESLYRDRLIVVGSRNHPLASAKAVALREIAFAKWILPWENAVSRMMFDDQFAKRGLRPPNPFIQTGDLLVMRPLLARGDMLAFTSWSLVRFEIKAGLLVEIDVDMDDLAREIVLLRREKAHLPPAALLLVAELKRTISPA